MRRTSARKPTEALPPLAGWALTQEKMMWSASLPCATRRKLAAGSAWGAVEPAQDQAAATACPVQGSQLSVAIACACLARALLCPSLCSRYGAPESRPRWRSPQI